MTFILTPTFRPPLHPNFYPYTYFYHGPSLEPDRTNSPTDPTLSLNSDPIPTPTPYTNSDHDSNSETDLDPDLDRTLSRPPVQTTIRNRPCFDQTLIRALNPTVTSNTPPELHDPSFAATTSSLSTQSPSIHCNLSPAIRSLSHQPSTASPLGVATRFSVST
jgi:hypothetical protein